MSSNKEREDVNVDLSHLGKFDSDFGKGIQVDDATREQPWFTSGLPREVVRAMVMEIMSSGKHGEFIVRDKASEAGTFALSVKENLGDKNSLLTFLVEKRGLKLTVRGTGEKFMTLSELIEHYTAEQRDTLGLQLLRPGTYILDAARKAREQLEANPEEAAALIKPNGAGEGSHLPQWLRVDNEIKAEVSQEKRDNVNNATGDGDDGPPVLSRRASRVRTSQSNLEHIKAMFHNGEQQYQLAGGDTYDFAAGDRAYDLMHPNADSDDENEEKMYAMANKEATYDMAATDGAKSGGDADYSLAAGAKESEYDMANRREQSDDEHVYSTASSEPNSESNTAETAADGADVYAMANSKETVPENNSVGGDDHATQTSGDSDRHFTAQDGAIYGLPQKKQSKLGKFLSGFGKKGSSQDVGRKQSN
eukprot:m.298985 g.298985  ORF g.298985 m.298985 type:complete len:421 (-) comp20101_c0_seq19:204-1466(-)